MTEPTKPVQAAKAPTETPQVPQATTPPAAPTAPQQPAMSELERQEFEAYKAEKARREELAKQMTKADGSANLDLDPKSDAFRALSIENQIRAHYLHARGTIQDYARLFKKTVPEVLAILDIKDVESVDQIGDLVDADDLQKGVDAPVRAAGDPQKVHFTLN